MKLDINEVYHKYIIRVVIFALFTFKGQLRQPNVYKQSIDSFVKKRIPWKVELFILIGNEGISKEEQRDLILDELLSNNKNDFLKNIFIKIKTTFSEVELLVDLTNEKKYERLLYS
jgi:hypothetical protein